MYLTAQCWNHFIHVQPFIVENSPVEVNFKIIVKVDCSVFLAVVSMLKNKTVKREKTHLSTVVLCSDLCWKLVCLKIIYFFVFWVREMSKWWPCLYLRITAITKILTSTVTFPEVTHLPVIWYQRVTLHTVHYINFYCSKFQLFKTWLATCLWVV